MEDISPTIAGEQLMVASRTIDFLYHNRDTLWAIRTATSELNKDLFGQPHHPLFAGIENDSGVMYIPSSGKEYSEADIAGRFLGHLAEANEEAHMIMKDKLEVLARAAGHIASARVVSGSFSIMGAGRYSYDKLRRFNINRSGLEPAIFYCLSTRNFLLPGFEITQTEEQENYDRSYSPPSDRPVLRFWATVRDMDIHSRTK